MGTDAEGLDALQQKLGYAFENQRLLETALTLPSYRARCVTEPVEDNQRLEFLGDAVFGLLAAQRVFQQYADEDEGKLTIRRARWASGCGLARLARTLCLGDYLRLGKEDEAAGGRDKERNLTDAMEAVFGAAWCDGGLAAAQTIFDRLPVNEDEHAASDPWEENPKGGLQELAQRNAWPDSPAYDLIETAGPDHAPVYTVRARVAGGWEAVGTGNTKRAAEKEAAHALLLRLRTEGVGA